MKFVLTALLLLTMAAEAAFDSEAWLAKRDGIARDAARLRQVYARCAASEMPPAEDVMIPVEEHPDGALKVVVQAAKARYFLTEGLVWGENVSVRRYNPDGSLDAKVDARHCVVDRASKSGWAEGMARLTDSKTTCAGDGVYFSSTNGYLKIAEKTDIVAKGVRFAGFAKDGKPSKTKKKELTATKAKTDDEEVRIRSVSADFDRDQGVILFAGAVRVDYADEYTMCADRLFAFLTKTNELSRVVAIGNVSVTNALRSGVCARAVYRQTKREIEMFGDSEKGGAKLIDRGDGKGTPSEIEGSRIRFWLDSEQVEVENSHIRTDGGRKGFSL